MADDGGTGEKTESATPKKRKDARERGQVLKSQEVVTAGSLLITMAALRSFVPVMTENLYKLVGTYLSGQPGDYTLLTQGIFTPVWRDMIFQFIIIMAPLLLAALAAGILLNVIQVGFLFSTKSLQPQMNRLNPLEGFKRMFSARTLFELLKSIVKVIIIGFIIYNQISSNLEMYPTMMIRNYRGAILQTAELIFDAAMQICAVLAGIAALDFFFQKQKYEKDLKMSKYEVKMEFKQQEGDPQIKGRMKQKQREMSMMRMMQSVPDADVVITNPTEYAVALKYDEDMGDAPIVIAKGKDNIAAKIKEIAKENKIEVIENKPLARSLFTMCEIGDFIPVQMYQAVAEILAQIFRKRRGR